MKNTTLLKRHTTGGRALEKSVLVLAAALALSACDSSSTSSSENGPHNPSTAAVVSVDRFSDAAAHLQARSAHPSLPAANAPVNFDVAPFITQGLGPTGSVVKYYNFDVQSGTPAPIYVFIKPDGSEVPGQLHVIDKLPGEGGYNDFWQVVKVQVPAGYAANTIASGAEVMASKYALTPTTTIVNCPVVPAGSMAILASPLVMGWYKDMAVFYLNFETLMANSDGTVPTDDIYVTFGINPGLAGGGPASGFKTESPTSMQTHNVVASVPGQDGYSPLWVVHAYNNNEFASVMDTTTAVAASAKTDAFGVVSPAMGGVNCPVVKF
jgi:hypothetical protein